MHCSSLLSSSSHVLLSRKCTSDSSGNFFPKFVTLPKITTRSKHLSRKFCLSVGMEAMEQGFGKRDLGVVLGEKDAVIIVDHGSRRQESNLMLNEFVAMFKGRTGYRIVEPAHMELAEPSIRDAFKLCVQQGANRVIVSPFFLFPGRHWHQDIPALAAEAAKDHSGVSYIVTAPLGLHELMVDVMTDRIKQCLSHVAGHVDECAVCAGTGRCRVYEN
ncbi:sirohydrochlorin ferrochelatase, chloroplastic-like [Iris pallida]|uniref:Sirohydrochlorin ferrochelatase, chloroplastic-like n=1 Tax=Iris pallida TaxID=29817 RepID=A0AAX6E5T7_IRIPA|nr:sirohydrochlorin ferrochelatase, chloroplastic-like [Iris pallida]